MDKLHTTLGPLLQHWEDLIADMDAIADDYREEGYRTLELHPGDVTAILDDDFGLDVMVPDNEFDELAAIFEADRFDVTDVYRRVVDDMVFLLLVFDDRDEHVAVLCPAYFNETSGEKLATQATEAGTMYTFVRRLDESQVLTFEHEDPSPFFNA
jgi:hypothetical protein